MVCISNYAALLVFAFACALGPGSSGRTDEGCEFVTTAELESAFGIPFSDDHRGGRRDNETLCLYVGKQVPLLVAITNSTLPPGSELVAWRAQRRANVQEECQRDMPGLAERVTFEIVPDLGDEAYACSFDSHAAPSLTGGVTTLYAAHGLYIFQITVMARGPGLLQAMAVLARTALTRLPR